MTNTLKPVTGTAWHNLGIQLSVPDHELKQIETNYPRDIPSCKNETLYYWFHNAKEQPFVDALEEISYGKLANEIRGGPSDGMHVRVQCLEYQFRFVKIVYRLQFSV